jgi:nucleotide-binding universal stress UspA family protein
MKTLWALEPFHVNAKDVSSTFKYLKNFSKNEKNTNVAFVVTRTEVNLNHAFDIPEEDRFSNYPKTLIGKLLKSSSVKIAPKQITVEDYPSFSTTKTVDKFLDLAKKQKSELVCLLTSGKTGLSRYLLGSFAETAIHRSAKDLLVFNPHNKIPPSIKKVFLLSDFSSKASKEISKVLKFCKSIHAECQVFHSAQLVDILMKDKAAPEVRKREKELAKMSTWIEREAAKHKVKLTLKIDTEWASISERALKASENYKADLVVVSAKSSPVVALMGGSITRQILRGSKKPVWVIKN